MLMDAYLSSIVIDAVRGHVAQVEYNPFVSIFFLLFAGKHAVIFFPTL